MYETGRAALTSSPRTRGESWVGGVNSLTCCESYLPRLRGTPSPGTAGYSPDFAAMPST